MKSKLPLIAGVVGIVALIAVILIMRPKGDDKPTATESPTAVTEAGTFDPGRYWDWQLTDGKLADEVRALTTTGLISLSGEKRVNRIAKNIMIKGNAATITIRDSVYWSDKTNLKAQHYVDAVNRPRELQQKRDRKFANDFETRFATSISASVVSPFVFRLEGINDEADLNKILSHRFMFPIRRDLMGPDPMGDHKAFKVALGPYHLADLELGSVPVTTVLKFLPNKMFYKYSVNDEKSIPLASYAQTAGEG